MIPSTDSVQEIVGSHRVLTSMMTPQMLITIPQAAIFGPQNRSDGMSAFTEQPID